MKSRISIEGHPIHPMLVALPIGLYLWTLVADVVYIFSGKDHTWYDISFWTGIAAWVTALMAALPGLGDYLTAPMNTKARLNATAHLVLNVGVVLLFFVAMLVAMDDGAVSGGSLALMFILHLVAIAILTVAGWLGAHLVYIHHLAVVEEGEETAIRQRPQVIREEPGQPGPTMGPQAR